jgi:hypothetical protein
MLPARDGFGLSIVDGPAMAPYFNGSSDPSDALFGNPPSETESPPRSKHSHAASVETADIPLMDEPLPEALKCEPVRQLPEYNRIEKLDEKKMHDCRSNDVLAGQGLRRPVRDEFTLTQAELSSPDASPAAKMQARRNREAIVRARKIKALQQAKKTMDNIVQERNSQMVPPPTTDELAKAFDDILRPDLPSPPPGYPPRHINRLTKTMVVAEQAPLPRGRPLRKPARLVLRERSLEQDPVAERQDDQGATSTDSSATASPATQLRKPSTPPQQQIPNVPSKSSTRNTPTSTAFFTPHSHAKHHSTPLLSMTALPPQAVTATATLTGGIRASLCSSSHTSTSREARLEARLEAVERENRLLEAALMAVLKTSGTLNRCPCVLLKERSDTAAKNTEHLPALRPAALIPLPASRATTPLPAVPDLKMVSEEKSVTGARKSRADIRNSSASASSTHTRRGSWDSNGSGISALEVYLRTKIGA